jgi:parvulin-like peptidyl-prolyl isomerase
MKLALLIPLFAFTACSQSTSTPATPENGEKPAEALTDKVTAMNSAIDVLMAKPEHSATEIKVQHILIGVSGAPRLNVTRTPGEAESMAADLYARALAGEDFATLVKNNSNDPGEGIYTLITKGSSDYPNLIFQRGEMALAFGDVGWRLQVGEIGVTRFDGGIPGTKPRSPFGYHIIKRLK